MLVGTLSEKVLGLGSGSYFALKGAWLEKFVFQLAGIGELRRFFP